MNFFLVLFCSCIVSVCFEQMEKIKSSTTNNLREIYKKNLSLKMNEKHQNEMKL